MRVSFGRVVRGSGLLGFTRVPLSWPFGEVAGVVFFAMEVSGLAGTEGGDCGSCFAVGGRAGFLAIFGFCSVCSGMGSSMLGGVPKSSRNGVSATGPSRDARSSYFSSGSDVSPVSHAIRRTSRREEPPTAAIILGGKVIRYTMKLCF